MLFVLYKNAGVQSGRALRKELGEHYEGAVYGGFPSRFRKICKSKGKPELVINLGDTTNIDYSGHILNAQDMVRSASNKKRARIVFQEKGVPSPALFLRGTEVRDSDLPVIGRTSYHRKGEGFWFCRTLREVKRAVRDGATHFLEFIPRTREYRVHLFTKFRVQNNEERLPEDYTSVKLAEKVWRGEKEPNPDLPQKNHEFGWVFLGQQNRREEELSVVRYVAKQAIAALGMDFGAVDIMYQIKTKRPYVLEVNSAPSLADDNANTCEVYAQRIARILQSKKEEKIV